MSAASAPRLTGGIAASALLHGGLIAAFLVLRPAPEPQGPPTYMVRLFAAPPGAEVTSAPVSAAPPRAAAPEKPAAAPPTPPKTKVPAKKAKPTPTPPIAAQTAPPKGRDEPKSATPPAGSQLSTGGKGSDVATVQTAGIEFPYPWYTNRVVAEILKRFPGSRIALTAEVQFVIRRDGSVDPASIRLGKSSGNYSFDTQAVGAVESAANAKVFGALPTGFPEDILPITFRFSPTLVK